LEKYSESSSSVVERDALRKMVLLRWSVGAVGAGSVPGRAVGGARFGVLRLGEGRVPSRDYVGRGKVPVAGKSMLPLPFTDIIYKKNNKKNLRQ
jgi:hypothetical protein